MVSPVSVQILRSPAEQERAKNLNALPEWDLGDLYRGIKSTELQADLEKARTDAANFADKYKSKLADCLEDGLKLSEAIISYEKLDDALGKIISFAMLVYTGNTVDPERARFFGDMQAAITEISSDLLFFTLEMNRLDDQALEKAIVSCKALEHYRPWIEDLRVEKPYQLDDQLEKLFHEKAMTGHAAWNRLFDDTIAGLRFEVDGEELALEQTLNLLVDRDEVCRRKASEAMGKTFEKNLGIFSLVTNTLAKDKQISDTWRGFTDVADSRHLANRVEGEVVNALVASVEQSFPKLSHRYYALKSKWFGMEALNHWDRNAPLPDVPAEKIGWEEAKHIVLDAYSGFAPEMASIAQRFFDENWIDAPVRKGKAPGAFAHPTVPSVHPYVLLNYQGKPRDVMTLAHELGHGIHQVLAGEQGALMAPTPLTLAETASVFGEMLTFKSLLAKTTNVAERRALIAGKVEDMLNTVVRQVAFYLYERKVHNARRIGELTASEISKLWMSVQADSLGPSVRLGPGYENYWVYVPHFIHSPFYVYAYAFGDCLVNSLYAVYEQSGSGFEQKYMDMLRAGGTKHHKDLLAPFGLDASKPDFW
ncbi:MAG: M3 family oligoendopeptidase, partial [Cohaesibacteraceae bacterium]|nr:M3 family oligoendopeptidase [Cohaesibacteraceae bacterium]